MAEGGAARGLAIWPLAARVADWNRAAVASAVVALPAALAIFGLVLRLHGLSDKPFWYDEFLTLNRTKLPFGELVINALTHKQYPTYFLLFRPFGSAEINEWALRFPSAVFGALCVFLVARLATDLRGPQAGVVAGLLMALSPFEVQFGQEARSYALISCLVLIAICGLVRIARRPQSAALPMTRPGALRGAWAAYTFGTIGALLVQNNTIPWLLASNLALMAIVWFAGAERNGLLRNWSWSQAIILLAWLPGLITMWAANRGVVLTALGWIPQTNWDSVWSIVATLYLFRISDMMTFALLPTLLPGFGAGIVIFAIVGAWRLKAEPTSLTVLGLAFAAMPIAALIISPFQPIFVPRYLLWSTGPLFVLAGVGLAALPARLAPAIAAVVAIGGALSLAPYYSAETKPRWDQATAYLANNAQPQDVIVAQDKAVKFMLDSYAERLGIDPKLPILQSDAPDTARRAAEGQRVWVAYGRTGQSTQEPEAEFRQKWSAFGDPAEQVRFGSHVLIMRFDALAAAEQQNPDADQPDELALSHSNP
jgi:mannosyltransferase